MVERVRSWWRNASPVERYGVMFGLPLVVILAVAALIRRRQRVALAAEAEAAEAANTPGADGTDGTMPGWVSPGPAGDASNVGTLERFQTSITEALVSTSEQLQQQQRQAESALQEQLAGLRSEVEERVSAIQQPDNPPAAEPDAPAPATQPEPSSPAPGHAYVVDNLGVPFVVKWSKSSPQRYRVSGADRSKVAAAFGPPLTVLSQTPSWYQDKVLAWMHDKGFTDVTRSDPIYLDSRIHPWREAAWSGQGIS